MMEPGIKDEKRLDPWWSMWTRPRATIRQIVDMDPEHLVLGLAAALGVVGYLNYARLIHMGDQISWLGIMGLAVVLGSLGGIVQVYFLGWLLRVTGRWIEGNGTPQGIRAAITWGRVPALWAAVLWVPLIAVMGQDAFTSPPTGGYHDLRTGSVQFLVGLLDVVIGIWAFVVMLKAVGEVQGFSAWKALGNFLLAVILAGIIGVAIGAIVGGVAGLLHSV
jgi:hypothetical protein